MQLSIAGSFVVCWDMPKTGQSDGGDKLMLAPEAEKYANYILASPTLQISASSCVGISDGFDVGATVVPEGAVVGGTEGNELGWSPTRRTDEGALNESWSLTRRGVVSEKATSAALECLGKGTLVTRDDRIREQIQRADVVRQALLLRLTAPTRRRESTFS